ncbi:methionine synthase I, cobalamin-binding domain protein [Desulforapulum autotrophicum HRM2]|uniref:Methionine synthase I, cobalamin-binding domain protein n=1 Tax=Desulforapulum autotrophicum (strain ATCC 43914 / DSM 3382 / VKM B-1955 / HRM2) TaxID=177437 RepID=C0QE32_DESAH|nr:homocysteine S-methyltransferase family protein [Desulforapulum autotrophicum]ACN17453.1 methionine synthase I, cobalamin-binding domain protein [Desulforapulum autotrophicum HRM2]
MNIIETIKTRGLLFDGGMGSMLIARGLQGGDAPERWNLTRPEAIQEVHQAYYKAGADMATTNTFGASAIKLAKMAVTEGMEEINRAGVKVAKDAKEVWGPGKFIAGDIGEAGDMLAPMGPLSQEDAQACFKEQAEVLAHAGVDIFIIETQFDLNMALAAIRGIRSVTDIPIACTMTFKQTPKGFFTIMGNPPAESMKTLAGEGAFVVGANCSMGSDTMVELAGVIRDAVDTPVMIQPNAGMPQAGPDQTVTYPETADFFADNIMKMKSLGIEVVGGCCGTTPDYIRTIHDRLNR